MDTSPFKINFSLLANPGECLALSFNLDIVTGCIQNSKDRVDLSKSVLRMLRSITIIKYDVVSCLLLSGLILYSRKYWRELNFTVGSQMAIAKALADFNLVVRYGIAIRIILYYASKKFWRILILRLLS